MPILHDLVSRGRELLKADADTLEKGVISGYPESCERDDEP